MKLSGRQLKQIHDALRDAYTSRDQLAMMVRYELDVHLDEITVSNNLDGLIFDLIRWAETRNKVNELVTGALNNIPTNTSLQNLNALLEQWVSEDADLGERETQQENFQQPEDEVGQADPTSSSGSRALRLTSVNRPTDGVRSFYDRSLALVIGINEYENHPRLANAVNDARAVANLLEESHGFDEIVTLYDDEADSRGILDSLRTRLPRIAKENDRIFIFYAGHGTTHESHREAGFLVPYGAARSYADYIDMSELQRCCNFYLKAKHVLLVLDCCFSGIVGVTSRATTKPSDQQLTDAVLRQSTGRRARQVLTAGALDELASDSSARPGHSAFTAALLEGLSGDAADYAGIITASSLYNFVRPRVIRETAVLSGGKSQAPYFGALVGSGQGDMVFVLPATDDQAAAENLDAPTLEEAPTVEIAPARIIETQTEPHPAQPQRGPIDFDCVIIPAGEFLMGSDKSKDSLAYNNEMPQHEVYLPEYQIARVPVTNAQYAEFVKENSHSAPRHWEGGQIPQGKELHPVVRVNWYDAIAFCNWAGANLPTEAQWEKAARGADGRIYPWGDQKPTKDLCNFNLNVDDTTPVGQYEAGKSPYGCLDMSGNVWEWTSSKHENYPYDPADGREDPEGSASRAVRGGSFDFYDNLVRCANRFDYDPLFEFEDLGFRVVVVDASPGL